MSSSESTESYGKFYAVLAEALPDYSLDLGRLGVFLFLGGWDFNRWCCPVLGGLGDLSP